MRLYGATSWLLWRPWYCWIKLCWLDHFHQTILCYLCSISPSLCCLWWIKGSSFLWRPRFALLLNPFLKDCSLCQLCLDKMDKMDKHHFLLLFKAYLWFGQLLELYLHCNGLVICQKIIELEDRLNKILVLVVMLI